MNRLVHALIIFGALLAPLAAQAQQTLKLVTEEYPPFNLSGPADASGQPTITGVSTETVHEMMKRAGYAYTMELMSWKRAYDLALETADYGVFSTTMLDSRKDLFKWVFPLVENRYVFFAREDSNLNIDSMNAARLYRVGGYRQSAMATLLMEQHFKLDLVSKDKLNVLKLDRGRIDLWPTGELLGFHYAKEEGITGIRPVYHIETKVMGVAFNKSVPDEVIERLNAVLAEIRADGTQERIFVKYR